MWTISILLLPELQFWTLHIHLKIFLLVRPSSHASHLSWFWRWLGSKVWRIKTSLSSSTCPYQFSVQISNCTQPGHENDKDARRLPFIFSLLFLLIFFSFPLSTEARRFQTFTRSCWRLMFPAWKRRSFMWIISHIHQQKITRRQKQKIHVQN